MDNKDNMTIEQLELLVQAYFDCELNRREEEDLKAVLLFAEAHSPLIDECRLAMGLESIAAHGHKHMSRPYIVDSNSVNGLLQLHVSPQSLLRES